jgi:hypothetical protein
MGIGCGDGVYDTEVSENENLFGEQLIREWTRQQEVFGLGALADFDPYDRASLPVHTGVYVLYDGVNRPVYVGKACRRSIRVRMQEHYEKFWFRRPIVDRGSSIRVDDEALCSRLEITLIKLFRSNVLLNRHHVKRD